MARLLHTCRYYNTTLRMLSSPLKTKKKQSIIFLIFAPSNGIRALGYWNFSNKIAESEPVYNE